METKGMQFYKGMSLNHSQIGKKRLKKNENRELIDLTRWRSLVAISRAIFVELKQMCDAQEVKPAFHG